MKYSAPSSATTEDERENMSDILTKQIGDRLGNSQRIKEGTGFVAGYDTGGG